MSISRTRTVVGSLYALMRNALALNVATPLESQEMSCTVSPDRRLVVLGHEPIAGFARDHGTVADEAAMLALHTLDSATLLAEPTFVAPGDSVLRADDPGWRWHCIAGHGTQLSDWERRPLGGALEGLATSGHTHAISAITGLQSALDAKAPVVSPALTGAPTAPTPPADDASTRIATTSMVHAALTSSGAGGTPTIKTGLRWWVVADESNQPVDLHAATAWAWQGAAAGASGKVARALQFAADPTSRIEAARPSDCAWDTGFTLAGWVQFVGAPAHGYICGHASATDAAAGRSVYLFVNGVSYNVQTVFFYGDGVNRVIHTSQQMAASGWCFICTMFDPSLGLIASHKVNGLWSSKDVRLAETSSGTDGASTVLPRRLTAGVFRVGNIPNDALYYSAKLIDSWACWDRPLTMAERLTLWNDGAGRTYAEL